MTFKEQIAADTKNVFMNALEFSEEHIIDGRNMLCIVDNNELMARRVKYKFRSKFYVDQVGIKDILIYVELKTLELCLLLEERLYLMGNHI